MISGQYQATTIKILQHGCSYNQLNYLCGMGKAVRQFVAYLLLLCIAATVVPFGAFHHHHEEDVHCDETNVALESDPCHISIYHGQLREHLCEHKSHFTDDEQEECQFCKFLTQQRHEYTAGEYYTIIPIAFAQDLPVAEDFFMVWNSSNSFFGRAPPIA